MSYSVIGHKGGVQIGEVCNATCDWMHQEDLVYAAILDAVLADPDIDYIEIRQSGPSPDDWTAEISKDGFYWTSMFGSSRRRVSTVADMLREACRILKENLDACTKTP